MLGIIIIPEATPVDAVELSRIDADPPPIVSEKPVITPHRAIYDLSLGSLKNGSNISSVSGRMLFEWQDVCDGWAIQQHLKLHFVYAQGDESDVSSTELTWESKDGKQYSFNMRHDGNGSKTDRFIGKATQNDKGVHVVYTTPENKELDLPPGTVFPSSHTEMIIQNALAGEKIFSRRVFDGSDQDGADDVSVFINNADTESEDKPRTNINQNMLMNDQSWPVRLAFYKIASDASEPDYEMNLDLLSNGIARRMMIDYGDFSVTGTLSDLEELPTPECGNATDLPE
jgi:hypothetical protein